MAEPKNEPYSMVIQEDLERAYATNLQHARRTDRPHGVDLDIWDRYESGRPWVLLNVGIIGLVLGKPDTRDVLRHSSRAFFEAQSSYWLIAELLANAGSVDEETAFERDLVSTVAKAVAITVSQKTGRRIEGSAEEKLHQLDAEAVTLLFCAVARNRSRSRGARWEVSQAGFDAASVDRLIDGVRSADRITDRRLSSLRAIANRRFSDRANLASLRSLIWDAIGASAISHSERDMGFVLMGVEPVLDPVTLAAAMLVLKEGDLREVALDRGGVLQTAPTGSTPRGWDPTVSLENGRKAFQQYLTVLSRNGSV